VAGTVVGGILRERLSGRPAITQENGNRMCIVFPTAPFHEGLGRARILDTSEATPNLFMRLSLS
jgi:hypothetical protein